MPLWLPGNGKSIPVRYWRGADNRKFRPTDRELIAGKCQGRPLRNGTRSGMFRLLAKYSRRRARDISRFCGSRQGATAVEFALVAPAFFALLIAIFQTAFFLFAQMALQNAAMEA